MRHRNWQHHVSRGLAGGAVVVEALQTHAMTTSAKGTVDAPGQNVRQKAGLNRVILATGRSGLRAMLAYKAPRRIAVDPRHTSQTCAACGQAHAASRRSQASFECVACGRADHADLKAARDIRRRGLALLHGKHPCRQSRGESVANRSGWVFCTDVPQVTNSLSEVMCTPPVLQRQVVHRIHADSSS